MKVAFPKFGKTVGGITRQFLLAALVIGFSPFIADSQDRAPFQESVALQTDSTVVKQLGNVRDHLAEKQWSEAVKLLQQILDTSDDTLVEVGTGRYMNAALYSNIILSSLPAEGLDVYRARVDPQARQWLESALENRDERLLRKIVRQAFASSYGDDALWWLGEWAWERHELAAARNAWRKLLPRDAETNSLTVRYPVGGEFSAAQVWARLILCSVIDGDSTRANLEFEVFKSRFGDQSGKLAGRTGNLASILSEVIADAKKWRRGKPTPVRTFAGNIARNHLFHRAIDVRQQLWPEPIELPKNRFRPKSRRFALPDPGPLSYFPVVLGDLVLICDSDAIYAYQLSTGKPRWRYPPSTEGQDARLPFPLRDLVGVPRYTMTINNGHVFARMGAPVTSRSSVDRFSLNTELIGLDLATSEGKLVWKTTDTAFERNDRGWAFEGTPVAAGNRLYVALRRTRPNIQFRVACFDLQTRKPVWSRTVCTAVAEVGEGYNQLSHQLLTLAEDTLFCSTELGAIAALDVFDGRVRWVSTYSTQSRQRNERSNHLKTGLTPCLFYQGTVVVAPADTDRLLAYESESGQLLWDRRISDSVRHLLGVGNGNLIVSGDQLRAIGLQDGSIKWKHAVSDPAGFGYGRGLLVEDQIYWPTREEIVVIDQRNGRMTRQPINLRAKGGTGGNLAIAGDLLLIAEANRLVAYTEFGRMKKRSRIEISAQPADRRPVSRLGQSGVKSGSRD